MAGKNLAKKLTDFDPDFSPKHSTNRKAARERGLRYNTQKQAYVDVDGCLIRDEYGHSLFS